MKDGVWEASGDRIGTGRRTAYALSIFPLDVVHRSTIRAMLPVGRTARKSEGNYRNRHAKNGSSGWSGDNVVSDAYRKTLKLFEHLGYVDRGQEFLRIKNRGGLLDHALADLADGAQTRRDEFVRIGNAVTAVEREIADAVMAQQLPTWVEQRRRELIALQSLMVEPIGQNWSGKGSVRFVPKSRVL